MAERGIRGLSFMGASVAAFVAVAMWAPPTPVAAQSIADIFRGKTIKLLLPTAPGGGRALYALPFAEAYGRHIPGNPTVVPVFMPGAGGATAVNYAYGVAAHDGLTIVSPLKSVLTAQAVGDPSVKYDVAKMNWLGRITDATQIFFVSSKITARTIDDFRHQQVIIGAVGRASVTYQNAAFVNKILGTKFKIVTGYQSAGSMNMSVESGETQGAFTTWNDLHSYHADWLRDGKVRVVMQIALVKHPDLNEVPLLTDLATNDADRKLCEFISSSSDVGEAYAAPPGVPQPVVAALRKAFDETMQDLDYIKKLRAAKIQFNPMDGAALAKEILKTISAPKSLVERYKAAIAGD